MNKKFWELFHRLLYIEGMSDCQKGIVPAKRHPTYMRAYSEEYARGESYPKYTTEEYTNEFI